MTTFVASNGFTVYLDSLNVILDDAFSAGPELLKAKLEAAQYIRDTKLGRWRWPDFPEFVVYPEADGLHWVLNEETGESTLRNGVNNSHEPFQGAAAAYIAAHPEPKPAWHDAQHDEVWVLTTPATGERPYQVVRTEEAGFRFFLISEDSEFRPGLFPNEAQITAGRRIYPTPEQ